jgi:photosystem II stability/assembly factor-like uncharacterized protein
LSLFLLFLLSASLVEAQQGWVGARRGPAGKDLNAVYFVDSKRGWIAGDDGFVGYTEDGGRTWSQQTTGTTDAINDIYFRNKDEGYLLAGNSIFNTRDGGRQWRELSRFLPAHFGGAMPELYSVRFTGKKRGWVVGSVSRRDQVVDSLVVYTDDGGASWQQKRVPTRGELIHLDFADDERGWIVGAAGTILHTKDGGQNWTREPSGTQATLYHVGFRNKNTGWAVGERATILRTTDGGQTWVTVIVPLRATLLSVRFIDENEGWIIGRGGLILHSEDGGRSWVQQETGTKQHLYALFVDKKKGWAVGGDGMVLEYER